MIQVTNRMATQVELSPRMQFVMNWNFYKKIITWGVHGDVTVLISMWDHLSFSLVIKVKPGSYLVRMRSECWRHRFATNNSPQLNSALLTCEYRCERRVVTSHSRQIRFAFAGSMNRALCWYWFTQGLVVAVAYFVHSVYLSGAYTN